MALREYFREMGKRGGYIAALRMTEAERQERARKGGLAKAAKKRMRSASNSIDSCLAVK